MEKLICQKLSEIEKSQNIRILLAFESGSRAWGFASTDSDYDVRFIYVRPQNEYLKLNPNRDVIELPINDNLDIIGWDLNKALRLMYKSNPTLFEWLSSPICYKKDESINELIEISKNYFSVKKSLFHYNSTCYRNLIHYFKSEKVIAKKYFYSLRPILACAWILENHSPPPMLFTELKNLMLPDNLQNDVDFLLNIKINSPEIKEISRIKSLDDFIQTEMAKVNSILEELTEPKNYQWNVLDEFFLKMI